MKHLKEQDYIVSNWSGGKTIQLAIAPEGALYADRDFLWRISSATVELEESDYTPLPAYDRLISPLEGEMVLAHNGGEKTEVPVYGVHAFSGADETHCWGCCTDFNLMTRRGECSGEMKLFTLKQGESAKIRLKKGADVLFYLTKGCCGVTVPSEASVTVLPRESLIFRNEEAELLFEAVNDTAFMVAQINL